MKIPFLIFQRTIILLLALSIIACSVNSRRDTIKASFIGLETATEGFTEWDRLHQQEIVNNAVSLEEGQEQLTDYRLSRTEITDKLIVAYKLLALAMLDLSKDGVFLEAVARVNELIGLIKEFIKD